MPRLFHLICFLSLLLPLPAAAQLNAYNVGGDDVIDPLKKISPPAQDIVPNYRQEMRDIVSTLSRYAKGRNPNFILLVAGGEDLLTRGHWEVALDEYNKAKSMDEESLTALPVLTIEEDHSLSLVGTATRNYLKTLDGLLQKSDKCRLPTLDKNKKSFIKSHHIKRLALMPCSSERELDMMIEGAKDGMLVQTIPGKSARFDTIPKGRPFGENANNITALAEARNMLLNFNNDRFATKGEWVVALQDTNLDMLVIDPFFKGKHPLLADEVSSLKYKKFGARRLVLAHLRLDQAEDTRYYWQDSWKLHDPDFLTFPAPNNPAGYIIRYWDPLWKRIVGDYFTTLINLGFDGVLLDGLNVHRHFEAMTPLE